MKLKAEASLRDPEGHKTSVPAMTGSQYRAFQSGYFFAFLIHSTTTSVSGSVYLNAILHVIIFFVLGIPAEREGI